MSKTKKCTDDSNSNCDADDIMGSDFDLDELMKEIEKDDDEDSDDNNINNDNNNLGSKNKLKKEDKSINQLEKNARNNKFDFVIFLKSW